MFDEAVKEFKEHAASCYPGEACGLVVNGHYVPVDNISATPQSDFEMPPYSWDVKNPPEAVLHSHTSGIKSPGKRDMECQLSTGVPWGISTVSESGQVSDPLWWGSSVPIPPLKGRTFRWGPSGSDNGGDCWSLVKDWYKIERDINLPEYPRDYEWWINGENMYVDNFKNAGFYEISKDEILLGDVILMRVPLKVEVPNHAGIFLGPTEGILHHLENRLSRQENITPWFKHITHYLRYGN